MRAALVKLLEEENHTNIRLFCDQEITGPDGFSSEVSAAAIADDCAVVAEYKNVLNPEGALQLVSLISSIE